MFGLALNLSWCDLPVLGEPAAPFGDFAQFGAKWLAHFVVPHPFSREAAQFSAWLDRLPMDSMVGIVVRLVFAAFAAVLPALYLARIHLTPRDGMMDIRGAKRFELGAGKIELRRHLEKIPNAIADLPLAPDVVYPSQLWTQHVLLVGGVGAGKSTFLRPLLSSIVKAGERLLCYDPKGEFTAAFESVAILAPWDARSWGWDIARDLRNLGDMERFAGALIQDSSDPMWANAARGVLIGLLVYLQSSRGVEWGWSDLADLISLPDEDLLKVLQRYYPEAARAVTGANVTTKGILINLDAFSRPIFHLARAWGDLPPERRISFVQWTQEKQSPKLPGARSSPGALGATVTSFAPGGNASNGAMPRGRAEPSAVRQGVHGDAQVSTQRSPAPSGGSCPRQIILQGNGAYPELTRAYVHGIFAVIGGIVNSVEIMDDPTRKLWVVADEFAQMGKIPIRPLFEVGRSRGVRCIVACQDFAQLEEVHGKEATRALISLCGTVMVGRVGPGETSEILSKALGHREVERSNVSTSYDGKGGASGPTTTLTYSRDSLALYVPAELAYRLGEKAELGGCVFAVAVQGRVYELLWPYATLKKVRRQHVPAKWTLGVKTDDALAKNKPEAHVPNQGNPNSASKDITADTEPLDKHDPQSSPAASPPQSAIPCTSPLIGGRLALQQLKSGAPNVGDTNSGPIDSDPTDPSLSRVSRVIAGEEKPGAKGNRSKSQAAPTSDRRKAPVTPVTPVTVMTLTGATAPVDDHANDDESGDDGFDGLDFAQEAFVSHDPAETAAKLALQALEMLKSKPGPKQRVVPAVRPPPLSPGASEGI
jgi:hypothetical protein